VCGCFRGTLEEFALKVDTSYPAPQIFGDQYRKEIEIMLFLKDGIK
jgi:hypothetical protein